MASYGTTTHRPSTTAPPPPATTAQPDDPKRPTGTKQNSFTLVCAFNIPSTPESAALRIVRNLGHFGLYYTMFVWIILLITLVPKRKVSLFFLLGMTVVTSLYFILLHALPNSTVLHRIIDKRLVLFLLAIVTIIELILTRAGIHLFVVLGAAIPVVLVHAVLTVREDMFVNEEASAATGELVPLVNNRDCDVESSDLV